MSRSYKKTAGYCDRNPFMKSYANRVVRRKPTNYTIANGSAYRKEMCSYDICDWKSLYFGSDFQVKARINKWWFVTTETELNQHLCKVKFK